MVDLRGQYQERIELWLRDVRQECLSRGLVCDGPNFEWGRLPISEPAWKVTVRTEKGDTGGVIVKLGILGADAGMESFTLYSFWTNDLLGVIDDPTHDVFADIKPYRPDVWIAGPEARLQEVLIAPERLAKACAVRLAAHQRRPSAGW